MEKTRKIKKFLLSFALASVFFVVSPAAAGAASLYFSPSASSHKAGSTFLVNVYVSSTNQTINAASSVISFPKDKLEVVSISKGGSIFSLWVQEPSFSNSSGIINFEGIVLNPGFTGSGGKIMAINFKAKAAGAATLSFSSGSVLANDGAGTNILSNMNSAVYQLTPAAAGPEPMPTELIAEKKSEAITGAPPAPQIFSSTHPDTNAWYNNNNPKFSWVLPAGVNGVSIYFSDSQTSNPGPASDGLFNNKSYENIGDGAWYVHLKFKNSYGWGPISHYKIQIDTTPPEPFEIKIVGGEATRGFRPVILFDTLDSLSGIDHYQIKIGEGDFTQIKKEEVAHNPYTLPPQAPGKRTLVVKALDKAGNFAVNTADINIESLETPLITDYPKELLPGQHLTIKGKTNPAYRLSLWLVGDEDKPQRFTIYPEKDGTFIYTTRIKLHDGVYDFWALAINNDNLSSNPTEKYTIVVKPSKIEKITASTIKWLSITVPLVALILIFLFILYCGWHKFSLMRKRLKKEVREAESALHKAFNLLRENIRKKIKLLEKTRTKRELTAEEEKIAEQLKKDLNDAEKFVQKEIEDIEKEIK